MRTIADKQHFSVICISFAAVLLLSFGVTDFDAFAAAGAEYTPTQPNAFASYDNSTNQIQIEWDFNSLPANTTCLLKGDFVYHRDLNAKHSTGMSDVDFTRIGGFIPLYYSVVSSQPVTPSDTEIAEVVPCTGSMRIDIDTIIGHSENINNFLDLEIFLTFYVANDDGSVNLTHTSRIDEVFIFYTPTSTWDNTAQLYACGGQIGSTLYIDATGIHGDNGDNCGTANGGYLSLNDNQYVDIGMAASASPGTPTYGDHTGGSFPLLFLVFTSSNVTTPGAGCNDCTPPTFGMNKNGQLLVSQGFIFNGNATNVTDFHTDFPLITVVTNQTNTITVKMYENSGVNNIQLVQFGLGIPEVGSPLSDAQILVEVWIDNTMVDEIVKRDENNLVDVLNVTTSLVGCISEDGENCLELSIHYIYRDQPKYNIMAINSMDDHRNAWTNYMNDGIEVVGESLNDSILQQVAVSQGGALYPQKAGTTTLTLKDYKTDVWTDEFGYHWSTNQYGPYLLDTIPASEPRVDKYSPWTGYNDRLHSGFESYKELQNAKAMLTMIDAYPNYDNFRPN